MNVSASFMMNSFLLDASAIYVLFPFSKLYASQTAYNVIVPPFSTVTPASSELNTP